VEELVLGECEKRTVLEKIGERDIVDWEVGEAKSCACHPKRGEDVVVAVLMEVLSGEELNQIGGDVEIDVGVLHICSWSMGRIPDFRGIIGTPQEEVFLEPGTWIPGDGWWAGEVEPMI